MKMPLSTIAFFVLFSCVALAQEHSNVAIEEIKNKFIKYAVSDWSNFKMCEYHSPSDDKKAFVEKTIDKKLVVGAEGVSGKEIFVTNENSGETLHLGVIIITYSSDNKNITNAAFEHEGYLKNSKILTRYLLRELDSRVVVYYSETFLKSKVKQFFDSLQ